MIPSLVQCSWSYRSVGPWHVCCEWDQPHSYIQNFTFATLVEAVGCMVSSQAPRRFVFDARAQTVVGLDFRDAAVIRGVGTREAEDLYLRLIPADDELSVMSTLSMFETIRQHCERIGAL